MAVMHKGIPHCEWCGSHMKNSEAQYCSEECARSDDGYGHSDFDSPCTCWRCTGCFWCDDDSDWSDIQLEMNR